MFHNDQNPNIRVIARKVCDYSLFLNSEINKPEDYMDMVHVLLNCSPEDSVNMYINSYGGNLFSAVQLIDAIQRCPAPVIGNASGEMLSAASAILLSCDGFFVAEHSALMIHTYSTGYYGKGSETVDASKFYHKHFAGFLDTIYKGFLTTKEINEVKNNNKDLYFGHKEIVERLENLVKYRKKQLEKAEKLIEE